MSLRASASLTLLPAQSQHCCQRPLSDSSFGGDNSYRNHTIEKEVNVVIVLIDTFL